MFRGELPRKAETSRHDESLFVNELHSEIDLALNKETPSERYKEIDRAVASLCSSYFPKEYATFVGKYGGKPNLKRVLESLDESRISIELKKTETENDDKKDTETDVVKVAEDFPKAFIAAAIIRYADDFIDKAIWPCIGTYAPEALTIRFNGFLKECLNFVHTFDPNMPESIIELPRIEMLLETHPTQENFDAHVVELVQRKSFDMLYVKRLLEGKMERVDIDTIPKDIVLVFEMLSCIDFSRDFSRDNYENDTDFNLRRYLERNSFDTKVLVGYVEDVLERFAITKNFESLEALRVYDEEYFDETEDMDTLPKDWIQYYKVEGFLRNIKSVVH